MSTDVVNGVQGKNVEGAQREITKYGLSVSSNQGLILKICGVLIAFLIFFLVVAA